MFVELKTDMTSRRSQQDDYYREAQRVGLTALLEGLITIFRHSDKPRKYYHLLKHLADLKLVQIPGSLEEIMARSNLRGWRAAAKEIQVTSIVEQCRIVYLQPTGTDPNILSFQQLRAVVQTHNDPISQRFAQSLAKWTGSKCYPNSSAKEKNQ